MNEAPERVGTPKRTGLLVWAVAATIVAGVLATATLGTLFYIFKRPRPAPPVADTGKAPVPDDPNLLRQQEPEGADKVVWPQRADDGNYADSNYVGLVLGEVESGTGLQLLTTFSDGQTKATSINGKACRTLVPNEKMRADPNLAGYVYFAVHPGFKASGEKNWRIEVEYSGGPKGDFGLEYDSLVPRKKYQRAGPTIYLNSPGEWKTAVFEIKNAAFANSQKGADFRLVVRPPRLWVRSISLSRESETTAAAAVAAAPVQVHSNHCLWKVQGKSSAVYLFGSIPFVKKHTFPLEGPIEDAYKQSSVVVFEGDINQWLVDNMFPGIALSQEERQKLAMYTQGQNLQTTISKEVYQKMRDRMGPAPAGAGDIGALLNLMRPHAMVTGLRASELQKAGFDPGQTVEKYFFKKAKKDKKVVRPLESFDFQSSQITNLSKEDSDATIDATLDETAGYKTGFTEMIEAWKSGDIEKLDDLSNALRKHPALYKKMMVDSNERWLGKVEELMSQGKDAFVVVGAAHLVGKDGLVEMLKKKGLSIQQM